MLLYLVGSVERLPAGSPLLKGNRLPVDSILEGAGLMTGQKSAHQNLPQEQGTAFCHALR